MELNTEQQESLQDLAARVREHFDSIEQDVPDQSFVVGGSVRDALLGLESNDLDFVVVGGSLETMMDRGFEPIEASSFPVLHDSEHEEWSLARTEQKTGEGYTGFEVFTDDVSLREDLERRDLTMNAMALLPFEPNVSGEDDTVRSGFVGTQWKLFDPHGGVQDIEDGVLRHVSDAFADDPLRCLRVARYAARFAVPTDQRPVEIEHDGGDYEEIEHQFVSRQDNVVLPGFHVASETMDMMRQVAPELNRMSRDRIGDEIVKAMAQARRPSRFFEVLRDSGALAVIWPELDRAEIVPAGPPEHHYEGSTWDHSMMVLDRMDRLCRERSIDGHDRVRRLMMAVSHDIGKSVVADKMGGVHSDDPPTGFPNHSGVGASIMENTARRLGLGGEMKNVMQDAADLHMRFHDVPAMPTNELLDFVSDHFPTGADNEGMRELPTNDEGEPHSFFGATAWELCDLAHADHEGRLKTVFVDEGGGVTDTQRRCVERPEFDREPFERRLEAVFRATEEVDGYEALESGLCDEHRSASGAGEDGDPPIDRVHGIHEDEDMAVQAVMSQCPQCRTPDDWVGKRLHKMKIDLIEDLLVGDKA